MKSLRTVLLLLALFTLALPGRAQGAKSLVVDIFGPGQKVVTMAVAQPLGLEGQAASPEGAEFNKYVAQDLNILPFLRLASESEILGGTELGGITKEKIDFNRFQLSKVDLLMTVGISPDGAGNRIEGRVYEIATGRLMVGKAYSGVGRDNLATVADLLCAAFLESLVGNGDIFRSVIAFTRNLGKDVREIFMVQPQGRGLKQVTNLAGASVSPSWSPDGRYLAFAHHGSSMHSLGIWDRDKDRIFRAKLPGDTIGGLAFTSQNRLVVALSRGGNMDIHMLTPDLLKISDTLVSSWGIDVSPRFDKDAKILAYTSDRQGSPQIFVKDMAGGADKRVTFDGKYNSSPCLSPDGRYLAYARMESAAHHRIWVMDLASGAERQVTFGPGSDETPTFAPDGYFIVYASSRGGQTQLYITTRFGGEPRLIPSGGGSAMFPSFGPMLTK